MFNVYLFLISLFTIDWILMVVHFPLLVGSRGYLVAAGRLLIAVASLVVNTGDSGFSSCYIG